MWEKIMLKKIRHLNINYFLIGYILSAVIMAASFAVIKVWPAGDHYALIIDSIHQYLPFYTDFRNKLAEGSSLLYSWSGGLGYNFWSTYAYYLAAPSNFLLYFVPMKYVGDFMDVMIILRIGLCGGCFTWYLHKRIPEEKWTPIAFGLAFALSSLILGYYFNLMWLDSIAMTPIIMYGIEKIIDGKSAKTFCISLFYAIWCNYYIGFMLCLFACLYFIVCYISETTKFSIVNLLHSGLKFTWFAILAGAMAAMVLFPAYMGLASTEALSGGSTFPNKIEFFTGLADMLKQHMAFLEPVNISDNQVGLNAYCGIGTVFYAILFIFNKNSSIRKRISYFLLCSLLLFSFSFNILNYIWHGFHIQNGLPNRFAFLYIAVVIVMAYDAFGTKYRLWQLIIAWLLPLGFLIYSYMNKSDIKNWIYYANIGILTIYFLLTILRRYWGKMRYPAYALLVSMLLIGEITGNCVIGVKANSGDTRERHIKDQESYQKLMSDKKDEGFFRSEVDRQWMRNVTMYSGGKGLVMFNSTMYSTVVDFCRQVGIEARTNKNGYYGVTSLMNNILGVKYLLSPSHDTDSMYGFQYQGTDDELSLYKNDNALSLGFMVNDDIKDWDIYDGNPLEVQNSFVELATGHDPIYYYDREIELADGQDYGIQIPDNKQVYVYMGVNMDELTLNTPEFSRTFQNFTDFVFPIHGTSTDNMADLSVKLGDKWDDNELKAYVYTCSNEDYQNVVNTLAANQLENVQVTGNQVGGNIVADQDGTLLLTIPYDKGWIVTVDGEETDTYAVGDALTGIHLTAGGHVIEMRYTPPGYNYGALISIWTVLLFAISGAFESKKFSYKKEPVV